MEFKELNYINPNLIWRQVETLEGSIFLDSSWIDCQCGRYSYVLLNPIKIYYVFYYDDIYDKLNLLQKILDDNQDSKIVNLPPFQGGLAGFISYDLNKSLENISLNKNSKLPLIALGLYDQIFAFDHFTQQCFIIVKDLNYDRKNNHMKSKLQILKKIYQAAISQQSIISKNFAVVDKLLIKSNFTISDYEKTVKLCQQYIRNGEIFEINLSQQFSTKIPNNYSSYLLYQKLRAINAAPFAGFINFGSLKILSSSPERFINIKNKNIETRPIKGTIKKDLDLIKDNFLKKSLLNSIKNRAENIMIVDLMRNDLSKICLDHSIKIKKLCQLESYSNLHHLVSVIEGDLKQPFNLTKLISALFPGGSITGAPKIRAMQLIDQLEPHQRGVYCGSIGYFGFNHQAQLSIAIRTIVVHQNDLNFAVGGAITLDSNPQEEYQETMLKAQKIIAALNSFKFEKI